MGECEARSDILSNPLFLYANQLLDQRALELLQRADWKAFVKRYHRTDLSEEFEDLSCDEQRL